ncbi:MAG: TIGR03790 family protein [Pseudomonadota bacterium]
MYSRILPVVLLIAITMFNNVSFAGLPLDNMATDSVPSQWGVEVEDETTLSAASLYIIANRNDPTSLQLAKDYQAARHIPTENILYVSIPVRMEITPNEALSLSSAIHSATKAKGFALAWSMPYRVGAHQSITSFVSMGYVDSKSFTKACNLTPFSPYFASGPFIGQGNNFSTTPLKPSMLLASYSSYNPAIPQGQAGRILDPLKAGNHTTLMAKYLEGVRATIAKGVLADYRWYSGSAYFLKTSDKVRAVRAMDMKNAALQVNSYLTSTYLEQDALEGKSDILIYETSLPNLDPSGNKTNTFLPGAIADTLTSYAGKLYDSLDQISALEFLRAGATATFGTVREPCTFVQKFPRPSVVASHLLAGDTVVEAYWKSVEWPTEGVFIGEPLARPYSRIQATYTKGELQLFNRGGVNGYYDIYYEGKKVATDIALLQNAVSKTTIEGIKYKQSSVIKAVLKAVINDKKLRFS